MSEADRSHWTAIAEPRASKQEKALLDEAAREFESAEAADNRAYGIAWLLVLAGLALGSCLLVGSDGLATVRAGAQPTLKQIVCFAAVGVAAFAGILAGARGITCVDRRRLGRRRILARICPDY